MTTLAIFNYAYVEWARRQPIAEASVMLTMTGIGCCTNNGGQCRPTLADLARLTNQSERTIKRNIAKLVSLGIIKFEPPLITLLENGRPVLMTSRRSAA